MQVPTLEQHEELARQLAAALVRIAKLEAAQPDWLHEEQAQQLTGPSQPTLAHERKRPDTLPVSKIAGELRYLSISVEAYDAFLAASALAEQETLSKVYSVTELAIRLSMSRRSAYDLIRDGKIRYACAGTKNYRVSELAVREFLGDR